MKKMKKIFAVLVALAMILGMSVTAFGANGKPQASDTAEVTINGITGDPTVTLYQIAKGNYGLGGIELVDYTWAEGIKVDEEESEEQHSISTTKPTADQINDIAKGLTADKETEPGVLNPNYIEPLETIISGVLSKPDSQGKSTYTATVHAGVYIAILTGASDDSVYNPILLSATYGSKGNLVVDHPDQVDADDHYLWGSTAVAKRSGPTVDKEITEGTVKDDKDGNVETTDDKIDTAGIGDAVTYTVNVTVPSYPQNALNKTFFISDTMTKGLTFDYSSLMVSIHEQTVTKDGDEFKLGGKVIATAKETDNGFNLNFSYDNLISNATTGAVYTPVVTYQAVINENAVVGDPGNPNKVTFYYANEPNKGETWDTPETKPDKAPGVTSKEDQEIVYTYQIGLVKVDSKDNTKKLEGAVFGVYEKDADENMHLIDKITTNKNGYAFSTKVAAGTYYVKELVAPTGYSLNTAVYDVKADWTTATTKVTGTITNSSYTTKIPSEDAEQVGWIKDSVFYAMDEFTKESAAAAKAEPAYLEKESTTTTSEETTVTNPGAGSGTAMISFEIPNTQLVALPSTGGIGTTIFTIGGCVIMIAAAGLYFASRRKLEKK